MIKPDKCIKCGKRPRILDLGDLVYVQCMCDKWNPYEFCGVRVAHAVEQWNVANARQPGKRTTNRGPHK